MNATAALLSAAHIMVTRIPQVGWVVLRDGEAIDAPQTNKRNALSVAVAYALGFAA